MIKKSINRWAFNKDLSIFECIELAKRAKFDAIEVNLEEIGDFSPKTKDKDIYKVREYCKKCDFKISSICSLLSWKHSRKRK